MEHFYMKLDGENWFTYPNLYSNIVKKYPTNSHFVEIGSWKGMSATYLAVEIINSNKNIKLDCIDIWEYLDTQKDIPQNLYVNVYDQFLKNIEPVSNVITPIKKLSDIAALDYKNSSLDFIFIDAAHDYNNVVKDIKSWFPKLKKGGTIAGHDYSWSDDVKKAVHDCFPNKSIIESEGCWIFEN